jgi:sigma-B regulation protein RsbU (phosphoserine phosphatase)
MALASQASLVRDSVEARRVIVDSAEVERIGGRIGQLFRSRALDELASLPRPFIEGYVASQSLERNVGGDFHDVVVIDQDTVGLLVGDGTGKGASGALNMLPLMAGFRAFANDTRYPASVLDRLSRIAERLGVDGTAVYLVVTRHCGKNNEQQIYLMGSSAGHPAAVLVRENGRRPERIPVDSSRSLGWFAANVPPTGAEGLFLQKGDVLVLYTDGISDAMSRVDETDRGRSEIVRLTLNHREDGPEKIAHAILERAIADQAQSDTSPDDKTVLVARIVH